MRPKNIMNIMSDLFSKLIILWQTMHSNKRYFSRNLRENFYFIIQNRLYLSVNTKGMREREGEREREKERKRETFKRH